MVCSEGSADTSGCAKPRLGPEKLAAMIVWTRDPDDVHMSSYPFSSLRDGKGRLWTCTVWDIDVSKRKVGHHSGKLTMNGDRGAKQVTGKNMLYNSLVSTVVDACPRRWETVAGAPPSSRAKAAPWEPTRPQRQLPQATQERQRLHASPAPVEDVHSETLHKHQGRQTTLRRQRRGQRRCVIPPQACTTRSPGPDAKSQRE